MSEFARSVIRALQRHGQDLLFNSVTVGTYSAATGTATTTNTGIIVKTYPKQVMANQYNMPNLIGKEVFEFYVAGSSFGALVPKVNDVFVMNSINYGVTQLRSYRANGQVILYKMIAVRQ